MEPGDKHWRGRVKIEEILEVGCPRCRARPHQWCDRSGDKLSKRGQALRKAGTPPSHTERMWKRQGHEEHEFPALRAKQRPGWDELAPQPGKRAPRPVSAVACGECGPCAKERAWRKEEINDLELFPLDFPCRHPEPEDIVVPGFPLRYTADAVCPRCKTVRATEVVVQDPWTIGYRCGGCAYMWLATAAARRAGTAA